MLSMFSVRGCEPDEPTRSVSEGECRKAFHVKSGLSGHPVVHPVRVH